MFLSPAEKTCPGKHAAKATGTILNEGPKSCRLTGELRLDDKNPDRMGFMNTIKAPNSNYPTIMEVNLLQ